MGHNKLKIAKSTQHNKRSGGGGIIPDWKLYY